MTKYATGPRVGPAPSKPDAPRTPVTSVPSGQARPRKPVPTYSKRQAKRG